MTGPGPGSAEAKEVRLERSSGVWARWLYWLAAKASAWWLSETGCVESAVARRSLATGEIAFARSDIDLALFLKPGEDRGPGLARLYQRFRLLRRLNPALGQVEIHRPGDLERFATRDTVWGSMERRSAVALAGQPPGLEQKPVEKEHACRRFLLWFELLLPLVLSRRRPREMQKVALEIWNFFALASGLIEQPFIRRADMMLYLSVSRYRHWCDRLRSADEVKTFALVLAGEFHQHHRQPLEKLAGPLSFSALVPPFCTRRTFHVLSHPTDPLPAEGLAPGSFVVTPEYLDLYVQMRNGFSYELLPGELRDTGIEEPTAKGLGRDLLYNNAHHFLFHPSFSDPHTPHPRARVTWLERAANALESGQFPSRGEAEEWERLAHWDGTHLEYYCSEYEELSRRTDSLEDRLLALTV